MIMRNLKVEHCGQAMIQQMHSRSAHNKDVTVKAMVHTLPA